MITFLVVTIIKQIKYRDLNVSISALTNLRFKFKTIRIKEVKQSDYLFI